jgi:hypothetical protein
MRYLFILLLLPVLAVASPREEASRHLNSLKKVDSPIKRLELFWAFLMGKMAL